MQSSLHATLPKAEADKACAEADYLLLTNRENSHRRSWELRDISTLNLEASYPIARPLN
jgi:hypothetical protein